MNNSLVLIATEGGYKFVTLNSAILPEDETSVVLTQTVVNTFREGQVILAKWNDVVICEYP